MKNNFTILLILFTFLFSNSCKKEINEPEHKNTGSNIMYLEFDGKKYLFEEKSFTFYKNIKATINSSTDGNSGKPVLSVDDGFFNLQFVIFRNDRFEKRKGNKINQIDNFQFSIKAKKDNSGNWVIEPQRQFSFDFEKSYNPREYSDYSGFGDGSYYQFSPKNDSKLTLNILNIDMENKTIALTLNGTVVGENTTKPIYIYMDVQWSY